MSSHSALFSCAWSNSNRGILILLYCAAGKHADKALLNHRCKRGKQQQKRQRFTPRLSRIDDAPTRAELSKRTRKDDGHPAVFQPRGNTDEGPEVKRPRIAS